MMTTDKIKYRNQLLKNFFELYFSSSEIKIIGNMNHPAVILDDHTCLSCYVHNYNLNFTDHPFEGDLLFTVQLKENIHFSEELLKDLDAWYKEKTHRQSFTVGIKDTTLKLAGYNYIDRDSTKASNRYPVFSERGYKIYLREENAVSAAERSSNRDLNLKVYSSVNEDIPQLMRV